MENPRESGTITVQGVQFDKNIPSETRSALNDKNRQ